MNSLADFHRTNGGPFTSFPPSPPGGTCGFVCFNIDTGRLYWDVGHTQSVRLFARAAAILRWPPTDPNFSPNGATCPAPQHSAAILKHFSNLFFKKKWKFGV
jgi:hypothetical protein